MLLPIYTNAGNPDVFEHTHSKSMEKKTITICFFYSFFSIVFTKSDTKNNEYCKLIKSEEQIKNIKRKVRHKNMYM